MKLEDSFRLRRGFGEPVAVTLRITPKKLRKEL
jgi:hypothetical protein